MTQGNGCPIVRNAVPALREVRAEYAERGVEFFLLNSSLQDHRASIAAEVDEFGFDMTVLVDEHQLVGESLNVVRTAEVFVIDTESWRVVYHGPVDDRLTYENQKSAASHTYLADALDAVLRGRPVDLPSVDSPGCLVNFPERARRDHHAQISYSETIAPLLEQKCVGCHQEGAVAPWAMNSFEMVKGFSPMIREVLRTARMPPWPADPQIGHFIGDRSLSPDQLKTLVHWIEAGSPRGEGPDPLARDRPAIADWPLGRPDLVLELPAFEVPATGVVEYYQPAVKNPLTESKWLRAATVRVGSRKAVHHVLAGHLAAMPADGINDELRWGASVGRYAVGAGEIVFADNVGTLIPAGGAIGFQVHYTPYGKAVTDRTLLGLYFHADDERPEFMEHRVAILDPSIDIPPATARHKESAYLEFPRDALLYHAISHAHYRGQSSTLAIRYLDGTERLLLSVPKFDFNWQPVYRFAEPIEIPAGSKLIARYEFDNSAQNPANPDPSRRTPWGRQSKDEMLYTTLSFRWKEETTTEQKPEFSRMLRSLRLFGMLDDDIDDVLRRDELRGRPGQAIARRLEKLDSDGDGAISRAEYSAAVVETDAVAD
jgi:hypothetical protein